ncbi:sulfate transporter family-domain-containing protein [Gorgonomyces haynaldii]|nr:sulfate transporter family-domain-containing protein [Gorgonomyces haynaldii]
MFLYLFFATSKDVTIGPTAVVSQLVGQVYTQYGQGIDPVIFATSTAIIAGFIELAIGLLNLGILVDFISTPVIAGFTSGAGITIIVQQTPSLLGIRGIDTNQAAFNVLIEVFKNLGITTIDATLGFSTVVFLLLWIYGSRALVKRGHQWAVLFGQAGNFVALVLFTLVSYLVNSSKPNTFRVVGFIPSGLNYIKAPSFDNIGKVFSAAGVIVLVSIMEHIAVTKSFGRVNGYNVDPNQEIIALGLTNFLGSFFGGFAATGSFSRSAVKSRSGVKTPAAGIFTATIVLISIFLLTNVFQHIPNAALSGVIIVAITDLISRPDVVKNLWNTSFTDFLSFWIGAIVTIFTSIETGIYAAVGFTAVVLLYNIARPKIQVLGKNQNVWKPVQDLNKYESVPGVAVFRIEESITYPNAHYFNETVKEWVASKTKKQHQEEREKLWCEFEKPITRDFHDAWLTQDKPALRAVIFDFSSVNHIDSSGVQALVDIKRDLDLHTSKPLPVLFANVKHDLIPILKEYQKLVRPNYEVTPMVNQPKAYNPALEEAIEAAAEQHVLSNIFFDSIDDAIAHIELASNDSLSQVNTQVS